MQNTNEEQQLFNSNELQGTDPFEEGKRKLGTYKFISVIGLCERGDVWFAKRIEDDSWIAIKRIHKCSIQNKQEALEICNQLNWRRKLEYSFVLPIVDVFQDSKTIFIVSDFCPCGNLYGYLQTYTHLPESYVQFIAIQLIETIQYLHSQNCLFCGCVAENVLVAKDGYIRLTGFSFSLVNTSFPFFGTVGYLESLSPEMLLNKGIDYSYDWYQLGCLLYELIEGHLPFSATTATATLQMILIGKVEYQYASKNAQLFINRLLNSEPKQRPGGNTTEIRNDKWFDGITWNNVCNKAVPSPLLRITKPENPTCYYPSFKDDVIQDDDKSQVFNPLFEKQL